MTTNPMTADESARRLREVHAVVDSKTWGRLCKGCLRPWPCPTALMLEDLRAERKQAEHYRALAESLARFATHLSNCAWQCGFACTCGLFSLIPGPEAAQPTPTKEATP